MKHFLGILPTHQIQNLKSVDQHALIACLFFSLLALYALHIYIMQLLHVIVDTWVTGKHKLCCTIKGLMLSRGQSLSATSAQGQHNLCLPVTHVSTDLLYTKHLA